jgi:hypothetical protein
MWEVKKKTQKRNGQEEEGKGNRFSGGRGCVAARNTGQFCRLVARGARVNAMPGERGCK